MLQIIPMMATVTLHIIQNHIFFVSAVNKSVLQNPVKKLEAGFHTCCTYWSTEIFNDQNKFVLLFGENDLPFFLWGQQLM